MYAIRVMTYNLNRWQGIDGKVEPRRVLEVVSRAAPDILALQESDSDDGDQQLACLAERLAMYRYGPFADGGTAFLSYYPLNDLHIVPREGGAFLRADAHVAGRLLHLCNVQCRGSAVERRRQLLALQDPQLLGRFSSGCPLLVLGDFADRRWGRATLPVGGTVLRLARRPVWPATFPASWPLWAPDRAYLGGQLQIIDVRIYRGRQARCASSHLPLLYTLRLFDPRNYARSPLIGRRSMEILPGCH